MLITRIEERFSVIQKGSLAEAEAGAKCSGLYHRNMVGLIPAWSHLLSSGMAEKYDWLINSELDHFLSPSRAKENILEYLRVMEEGSDDDRSGLEGPIMLMWGNAFVFNKRYVQVLKANWANLGRVADSVEEGGRAVGCPMFMKGRVEWPDYCSQDMIYPALAEHVLPPLQQKVAFPGASGCGQLAKNRRGQAFPLGCWEMQQNPINGQHEEGELTALQELAAIGRLQDSEAAGAYCSRSPIEAVQKNCMKFWDGRKVPVIHHLHTAREQLLARTLLDNDPGKRWGCGGFVKERSVQKNRDVLSTVGTCTYWIPGSTDIEVCGYPQVGGPLVVGLLTPQRNAWPLEVLTFLQFPHKRLAEFRSLLPSEPLFMEAMTLAAKAWSLGSDAERLGSESAGDEAQPQEQAAKDQERPGVPIAPTPSGQKETRKEHIASEKHGLGHEELPEVQRAMAVKYGHTDPAKICDDVGKDYFCTEVLLDENNKRVHVEVNRNGIVNAWWPTQACKKEDCKIDGETYAKYNEKSNRQHVIAGQNKGKFAKGTKGPPVGLVTDNKDRSRWKNPQTGSPRENPLQEEQAEAAQGRKGGIVEGGGSRTTTNAQGELVEVKTKCRADGMEEIDYTAEKKTKDGTKTTKYKNASPVDAPIGHSEFYETVTSNKGELFQTRQSGRGELDKKTLETRMVECEKTSYELRDEVKAAIGQGVEVGALVARKRNEQQLYISEQQENEAILSGLGQASAQGAAQVGALIAKERIERACDGLPQAPLRVASAALAGGVAMFGDGEGKLDRAAASASACLALSASQEVASGVLGPGRLAGVAGSALGAFAASSGSCQERLAKAAQATGEGAAVQAAGSVLAGAGVLLCPTKLINEEGRKGMEFAGGSMVSVGQRDRYGSGQLADGTTVTRSSHEEGVQLRAGTDLSDWLMRLGTALAASGNPSALLSGLGSVVGISGNVGVTQRSHLVERMDGSYSQHAEALHGFAGGVDVVGVEKLNLDTGHATVRSKEHEKAALCGSRTTETVEEELRVLGQKVASQELSFKHAQENLLGSKEVTLDCRTGEVVEKADGLLLSTSQEGSGTVDRSSGKAYFDGEVSWSIGVRQEVKDAAGRGIEVGGLEMRRANEERIFCSGEDAAQALKGAGSQVLQQGAVGVVGLIAGEMVGKVAGSKATGAVLGEAAAAGGVAMFGDGEGKLDRAAASAKACLALSASQEVASGVLGPGRLAGVAGSALGVFAASSGSCQERLAKAAQATGEGAAVQAAGSVLAGAGVPLCPTKLINEEGRKGMEFAGGSMVSVGQRDRYGSGQLEDGTTVTRSSHEEGVQLRAGLGTALAATGAGVLATGVGSLVGVSGNVGVTETVERREAANGDYSMDTEKVWGFAGAVDVTGVNVSHVLGFGSLNSGVITGVHVEGGESATGNFIISAEQEWKKTTHSAGIALMGLKLEVPYQLSETSGKTLSICGLEWYRCSELRDTTLWGQSGEKTQTFLLLVEVRESFVETWFGSRRNQLSLGATPELKGIVGRGAASAITAFFTSTRQGASSKEALARSCAVFRQASLDGALDVGLSCMAANLSNTASQTLLESSSAWAALSPYLEDGVASLVRPIVQACLKGSCQVEDFGREWLKQFIQLQLLRLLRQAGVSSTALQLLSASYSKIFDNLARGNLDLLQLLVDLAPVVLEVLLKAAVSGTTHGWLLAYVVVPLLLELFKSTSVQSVLGQVSKAVLACATSLKEWVVQALERLGKLLLEVGAAGVVTATAAGVVTGMSAASVASAALAPSACVAGSPTLGSVAVSLGLMASPAAPAGLVLGVASVSGVVVGAVILLGFKEAQLLLREEFSQGSWQQRLEKDSLVSVFITKPRRRWVDGRVCRVSARSVNVKYFLGKEEHHIPVARDDARQLRPGGADGAVLAISGVEDDAASPSKVACAAGA
ncbi:unnamed protein product [Symbiodinium sp. CCMP2592]|nr:unnamed protein product [Symbiodinium sp. CCMP2592]